MYDYSKEIETKKQYNLLVDETISLLNNFRKYSLTYEEIFSQLLDLRKNVIEERLLHDPDEIDDRYSFGGLAVRSFEEGNELRERLSDILWGALHYDELVEEK